MVVIPVAIFLAQGNMSLFGTVTGAVRALGMLAGLVATALMCQMLLLAARIPFVDGTLGHDRALRRHRALNGAMITLLIMHGVLLVISYAAAAQLSIAAEFTGLLGGRDFVLAVLAMVLLGVVGFSSAVAVKAKLSHEVWHVIHLVSYLAVVVAIPHQFSMGGMFSQGLARAYWIGMFAVTFFCLLCFRFGYPLFNSMDHQVRVVGVQRLSRDTVNIYFKGRDLDELDAHAGQFFSFRFLQPDLWWHAHPFSLSSPVRGDGFRITVRALGKGSAALARVRPGTPVLFQGPYGMFSDRARTTGGLILVGSGAGLGAILAVLEETSVVPGRALVILRATRSDGLYNLAEFQRVCTQRGVQLVTMVGHRARYSDGTETWVSRQYAGYQLGDFAPWARQADIYVCGPEGFLDAVVTDARAYGVPEDQVHGERFEW